MPYKDPEQARAAQRERSRRYRARKHAEQYGPNAGPQTGKHGNHAKGIANGRWNNSERRITSGGYIAVRVPLDHPHAWGPTALKRFRYAYEHVIVMVAHLGRRLAPGETIHHRNGNKTDNRIENLELTTASEHQRHHANNTRQRDSLGRFM